MDIVVMNYNRGCVDIINVPEYELLKMCPNGDLQDEVIEEILFCKLGYRQNEVYYMYNGLNKQIPLNYRGLEEYSDFLHR